MSRVNYFLPSKCHAYRVSEKFAEIFDKDNQQKSSLNVAEKSAEK